MYPGGVAALKGLDLAVVRGEFLSIIGLSGAGKSTLLRCINRLIEPTEGRINYVTDDGRQIDVLRLSGSDLTTYRSHIGMIFQQFNLIPRLTVIKNVLSGSLGRKSLLDAVTHNFSNEDREFALTCLERVGIQDKAYVRADQLSGGQMQRTGIARALMQNPEMILADEPVSSLDPATSMVILNHLREICHHDGITIVCNLHDLGLAKKFSDRIVGLVDGKIIYDGPPERVDEDTYEIVYGVNPIAG